MIDPKDMTVEQARQALKDMLLPPAILVALALGVWLMFWISGHKSPEEQRAARQEAADQALIIDAEVAVRNRLRDPDSAQFGTVWVSHANGLVTVCGRVNAKNAFGGYTGEQPFFYTGNALTMMIDTVDSTQRANAFLATWQVSCAS